MAIIENIEQFVAESENGGAVNCYFLSPCVWAVEVDARHTDGTVRKAKIHRSYCIVENGQYTDIPCRYEWIGG